MRFDAPIPGRIDVPPFSFRGFFARAHPEHLRRRRYFLRRGATFPAGSLPAPDPLRSSGSNLMRERVHHNGLQKERGTAPPAARQRPEIKPPAPRAAPDHARKAAVRSKSCRRSAFTHCALRPVPCPRTPSLHGKPVGSRKRVLENIHRRAKRGHRHGSAAEKTPPPAKIRLDDIRSSYVAIFQRQLRANHQPEQKSTHTETRYPAATRTQSVPARGLSCKARAAACTK